ncbi:MAG: hypothetical protein MUO22_05100 [Sedimentisphaerales bacterium]|nr:hypothetical protein [Sedimentisphaerales bacterium]
MGKRKVFLLVLLVLIIPATFACYYYFWPRYVYKTYGYHDIKTENEHSEWWITLDTSGEDSNIKIDFSKWWNRINPHSKKINIYGSPYHLSIRHGSELKTDKVEIIKFQTVVFSFNDGERITHKGSEGKERVVTIFQDINLDYDDYEIVVYYSIKDQGNVVDYTLKAPLKTNYVEAKVSLFEVGLGI